MLTVNGTSIYKGTGIGRVTVWQSGYRRFSADRVENPEGEDARFEKARTRARAVQENLSKRTREETGGSDADIFEMHALILADESLLSKIRHLILEEHRSAEYAVQTACRQQADVFARMDDPYMQARSGDLIDIGRMLLDFLTGGREKLPDGTDPLIITADDLTASELVRFDRGRLAGIVLREGSPLSHTAILAKSLGIPALVHCAGLVPSMNGRNAILDGHTGTLYIDPDAETAERLLSQLRQERWEKQVSQSLRGLPNVTKSGRSITIRANISGPEDLNAVRKNDADGVGLFRTEFMYLRTHSDPSEEEQFAAYSRVVRELSPARVVFRTCDLGADKTVSYLNLAPEKNPALGYRAIRICLNRKEFFRRQLRAILRAAACGNAAVMFPMITSVKELRAAKQILAECRSALEAEGVVTGPLPVGVMIETPAAVLTADELAKECSFFSIGTNALSQYPCAIDRENEKLEPFFDEHHPAILREIQMTVEAGHRAKIPVAICGELGSDETLTQYFLDIGVDALSVNPDSVLGLRRVVRECK